MPKKTEYRTIHSKESYLIQESDDGNTWCTIGEFDELERAKEMLSDLRSGKWTIR